MKRIDAVVLQIIVTEYDAAGVPIGEQLATPVKVFLPKLADVIEQAKTALAESQKAE